MERLMGGTAPSTASVSLEIVPGNHLPPLRSTFPLLQLSPLQVAFLVVPNLHS